MAETHGKKDGKHSSDDRRQRLKAALKANMAKRKTQARARSEAEKRTE